MRRDWIWMSTMVVVVMVMMNNLSSLFAISSSISFSFSNCSWNFIFIEIIIKFFVSYLLSCFVIFVLFNLFCDSILNYLWTFKNLIFFFLLILFWFNFLDSWVLLNFNWSINWLVSFWINYNGSSGGLLNFFDCLFLFGFFNCFQSLWKKNSRETASVAPFISSCISLAAFRDFSSASFVFFVSKLFVLSS